MFNKFKLTNNNISSAFSKTEVFLVLRLEKPSTHCRSCKSFPWRIKPLKNKNCSFNNQGNKIVLSKKRGSNIKFCLRVAKNKLKGRQSEVVRNTTDFYELNIKCGDFFLKLRN